MKTFLRTSMFALCVALAPPVLADEPAGPDDQAKVLAMQRYEQGEAAFSQGRFKDAIDLFLAADRLVQHPAFPYNIAVAYEEMGDVANALRWAREFLHRTPNAQNEAEVRERIAKYQARLVQKGVQQVTVRSTPVGATVVVDGRPVGVTPWTGELVPGSHGVELRLEGHDRAQKTFDLPAAEAITVSLELSESAPGEAPPPPAPIVPAPNEPVGADEASSPTLWPWAAVVGGVGLAGIGAAVGLEMMRSGKNADAEAAPTQIEAAELAAQSEDLQLGARIALGVGAGLVAVGATLLVVDLVSSDGDGDEVALGCGPGGCRLVWRGDL